MNRTLFLSGLVAVVALALAAGSYTALADKGGPGHGAEHGVATGLQEDGGGDVVEAQDNGDDGGEVESQGGGDGEGAGNVALVIEDAFGAGEGDVLTLHEAGFGFGAIFKLYLLAAAGDPTALAILADGEKGEGGFAFGKLFKEFADEVSVLTEGEDGMPKNLGKAVSASNKSDEVGITAADGDGDEDDGDGPPAHAPAHGWRR